MSDSTTDRLTELLHKKADEALEKRFSWLTKEAVAESHRLYTQEEITIGSRFCIPKGTWIPSILFGAEKALMEAHRDTNREAYVREWLRKVNETMDAVNDLQGGAQ